MKGDFRLLNWHLWRIGTKVRRKYLWALGNSFISYWVDHPWYDLLSERLKNTLPMAWSQYVAQLLASFTWNLATFSCCQLLNVIIVYIYIYIYICDTISRNIGIQGTHHICLLHMHILPLSEDDVEQKADETKYDPSRGQDVVDNDQSQWLHSDHFYGRAISWYWT